MTEQLRPSTPVATPLRGAGEARPGGPTEGAAPGSAEVRAELIFRVVNEHIRSLVGRFGKDSELDLVCECADQSCFERLTVTVEQYDAICQLATRFVVKPGHAAGEAERVVEETRNFLVVERIAHRR